MEYEYSDIIEGVCTVEQYYAQYPSAIPVLGESFVVAPNQWDQAIYKIIYIDETVALGERIEGLNKGTKTLFNVKGNTAGWKYQDNRAHYRLQSLSKIKKGK